MDKSPEQEKWERSVNWNQVGPQLIEALEDIDYALAYRKVKDARDIIGRVWKETGRDKLDEPTPEELAEWPDLAPRPATERPGRWVSSRRKFKHREQP
jgi:hypothetical protein